MTFNEYSSDAATTVQFVGDEKERLSYLTIALAGEVGEFCNELKKIYRKGEMPSEVEKQLMLMELGDVLWYLDRTVAEMGSSLDTVALMNLNKLRNRYMRKGD